MKKNEIIQKCNSRNSQSAKFSIKRSQSHNLINSNQNKRYELVSAFSNKSNIIYSYILENKKKQSDDLSIKYLNFDSHYHNSKGNYITFKNSNQSLYNDNTFKNLTIKEKLEDILTNEKYINNKFKK